MRLYGEIIPSFIEGIIDRTGPQIVLCLTCTMISSVDLAHYISSHAKDWVSVGCGTSEYKPYRKKWFLLFLYLLFSNSMMLLIDIFSCSKEYTESNENSRV